MCVKDMRFYRLWAKDRDFQCQHSSYTGINWGMITCTLFYVMRDGERHSLVYYVFKETRYFGNRVLTMRPLKAVNGSADIMLDLGPCYCPLHF